MHQLIRYEKELNNKERSRKSKAEYFQLRGLAIFTAEVDETYDAYDKDIAMVSFFFKKATMFRYSR